MIMRRIVVFILGGLGILLASISLAGVKHNYIAGEKVKTLVSNHSANRIEFSGQSISEVIGDESQYQLISDKHGSNIFILPKVAVGKTIAVSLITTSGLVQDMELVVSDISSQNIIIELAKPQIKTSEAADVAEIIKAMRGGVEDNYYVQRHNIIVAQKNPNIEFRKVKTYQFGEVIGVIGEIRNKTASPIELREDGFNDIFAGTIGVSMEKEVLPARGKIRVFIVTKGRGNARQN
jgi:hypothetical protein